MDQDFIQGKLTLHELGSHAAHMITRSVLWWYRELPSQLDKVARFPTEEKVELEIHEVIQGSELSTFKIKTDIRLNKHRERERK